MVPCVRRNALMFNNEQMADVHFIVGSPGETQRVPAHKVLTQAVSLGLGIGLWVFSLLRGVDQIPMNPLTMNE